jgi:2-polyprenyl-3-methyl-5-hydroxy-6-metoxy-1,4-benzoquinol methylase
MKNELTGFKTLRIVKSAENFNRWMYETIKPFCSGEILEIGSGIGNISQFFLNAGYQITLSDINKSYCEELKNRFSLYNNLRGLILLDIACSDFDIEYRNCLNKYDTVFSLNVIEHIQNDVLAINNCYKLLKPNGKLIILAPAYQILHNKFDIGLQHYRRYTKKSLNILISRNKFRIIKSKYFNAAGILGWYISGKLQKNKNIPEYQMNLFDNFVFIFRVIDKMLLNQIGLSVLSIAQKN